MHPLSRYWARVTLSVDDRSAVGCRRSYVLDIATFAWSLMRRAAFLGTITGWALWLILPAVGQELDIEREKIIRSKRPDGRHLSTRGFIQHLLRTTNPRLAFDPDFTRQESERWRLKVRTKLRALMDFPEVPPQPAPRKLWTKDREGYVLEKWEVYPEPGSVVPYLVLIPDGTTPEHPAPAVMCFPGSSGTKENLAGEPPLHPSFSTNGRSHDGWRHAERNQQAVQFAKAGLVAVAVDHPGNGELSDLAKYRGTTTDDRRTLARYLIDLGRDYIALSVFQKMQILEWLRARPFVDADRIALSGHSLGTEPLLVMAVLDPHIHAIVWNDFLCPNIERAKVSTKPNKSGVRPPANWLGHCVPEMWKWFDYPDLVAAFAPRPLILTEGGPTHSLNLVRQSDGRMGEWPRSQVRPQSGLGVFDQAEDFRDVAPGGAMRCEHAADESQALYDH